MLSIAELLQQTAVVCNSIAASHHAETAGEHLERRYATLGKAAARLLTMHVRVVAMGT